MSLPSWIPGGRGEACAGSARPLARGLRGAVLVCLALACCSAAYAQAAFSLAPGGGADIALDQIETVNAERLKHAHRLMRHFRANSVTSKNRNPHAKRPVVQFPIRASRSPSWLRAAITSRR